MPNLIPIDDLINTPAGQRKWIDEGYSIGKHLQTHASLIALLAGVIYVVETGYAGDAYTGTLAAVTGKAMPVGLKTTFLPTTTNTGASTVDYGSTEGAIAVKKWVGGAKVDIGAGDFTAGSPVLLYYDGADHFILPIGTTAGINEQTTTSYTLTPNDRDRIVRVTSSTSLTVTIPEETFSEGDMVGIEQGGSAQATIVGGSNVSLDFASTTFVAKTLEQGALLIVYCKDDTAGAEVFGLGGQLDFV